MNGSSSGILRKAGRLGLAVVGGILVVVAVIAFARSSSRKVYAAAIPPPEGYPKLSLSTKTVTPTLANIGTSTLHYKIEIRNTGAYTANNVNLTDVLPDNVTYNDDAAASATAQPTYDPGTRALSWQGRVGFDSTVVVSYSVDVTAGAEEVISNTAVISQALIAEPVTVTAETLATDQAKFTIEKSSVPPKPGAGKPLTYTLSVTNIGQSANNLPVTVVDEVPNGTTFKEFGPDGSVNPSHVNTDAISGTVINNDTYHVSGQDLPTTAGEPYTVTVIDPIFLISKQVDPFPPGSNREMTYTLSVFNKGSLATVLEVTDVVPENVTYERGGTESGGVVSWDLPSLDSGESAQFTYTVSIGDIADVTILNDDYEVCSAEGVCEQGDALASLIRGPTFEAGVFLDPVAKKPGGGTGPVTPTIVLKNLGPGSALDASALMYFRRISVSFNDLLAIPNEGQFSYGPDCGDKCVSYFWTGDLGYDQAITLTTIEGQSSVGGEEGTHYTATVVITDTLGMTTTEPFTGTAVGTITHFANLIPTKSAPPVVGAGQPLSYTIRVYNSGLSTEVPPYPTLTETIPLSTTFLNASDDGVPTQVGGRSVISWSLPAMSPGDEVFRSFAVSVDSDLISGTKIVNDDYRTAWSTGVLSNTGEPVTTVVKEVGLIDSFKTVTPTSVLPGEGNILTYTVHVVNSGPSDLKGVKVQDLLPWQNSTYQRDAVASAGQIISDIVSIDWTGSVAPYSSQLITFTVLVDKDFQGPLTNTATIKHSSLLEDVVAEAVAYVTDKPVLQITKSATPDPVKSGGELLYKIKVENLGQQATDLVVTDTIPANTDYILGSASASGQLAGDHLEWRIPVLDPGEVRYRAFHVTVGGGNTVTNESYGVTCAEGVSDTGPPLITQVTTNRKKAYLPLILR
ncbi:MAG: hypothetical protein P8Y03_20885 [Anaerolineales bacterium]